MLQAINILQGGLDYNRMKVHLARRQISSLYASPSTLFY
jgi:hypothetical protein